MNRQIEQLLWELLATCDVNGVMLLLSYRRMRLTSLSLHIRYFEICNAKHAGGNKVEQLWLMMKA